MNKKLERLIRNFNLKYAFLFLAIAVGYLSLNYIGYDDPRPIPMAQHILTVSLLALCFLIGGFLFSKDMFN